MEKQMYDVHFTLRGFVMIAAADKKQAEAEMRAYMTDRIEYLDRVSLIGLDLQVDAFSHAVPLRKNRPKKE